MNVKRALTILPEDAVLSGEQTQNYYGTAWCVWATFADGERRVVTQFATSDPWGCARWINEFENCRQAA